MSARTSLLVALCITGCGDSSPAPVSTGAGPANDGPRSEAEDSTCPGRGEEDAGVTLDERAVRAPCDPDLPIADLTAADIALICNDLDSHFRATSDRDAWARFLCFQTLDPSDEDCETRLQACLDASTPYFSTDCFTLDDVPEDCDATVRDYELCATELLVITDDYLQSYDCESFQAGASTELPQPSVESGTVCGFLEQRCPIM